MVKVTRALAFGALLALCGLQAWGGPSLQVEDAYVRGLPPTQRNTAAFFTLKNTGDRDLQVLAAPAPDVAARVEIHAHRQRDGMMSMQKQDSVTVAAGQSLVFAPGGLHLMLIELNSPLRDGDTVSLALHTAGGDTLIFRAPVISVLREGAPKQNRQDTKDGMGHVHH